MLTIAKVFEWDMGHRVTNHANLCHNPHGHRYKLIVYISGPVIEQAGDSQEGMILDFGLLKQLVNESIIDRLDHSFMFWKQDKIMASFAKANPSLKMNAVPFVPTAERIAENIAKELEDLFKKKLEGVELESIELFETPKSKATWKRDVR